MSNTFYDHLSRTLFTYDPKTNKNIPSTVKFLDSPAPPDHQPKYPDLEYQTQFIELAQNAVKNVNKKAKNGFVIDLARLSEFPGEGYMDGNFVLFVVRSDHQGQLDGTGRIIQFSDADYRYEMRAFDSWKAVMYRGADTVQKEFEYSLSELDARP